MGMSVHVAPKSSILRLSFLLILLANSKALRGCPRIKTIIRYIFGINAKAAGSKRVIVITIVM